MDMALMAAPPVENRKAAAINSSQLVARDCGTGFYPEYQAIQKRLLRRILRG